MTSIKNEGELPEYLLALQSEIESAESLEAAQETAWVLFELLKGAFNGSPCPRCPMHLQHVELPALGPTRSVDA